MGEGRLPAVASAQAGGEGECARKSEVVFSRALSVAYPGLLILHLMLLNAAETWAADLIGYQQLHAFHGGPSDGESLYDAVIEGSDGRLYGATVKGGPEDGGLVFAMNKDGSGSTILHFFGVSPTNGLSPWGGVIQGSDGRLYGATRRGGTTDSGTVFRINTNGTGFTIVRSFTTNANDGAYPLNSVIEGSDGRLYGRTLSGSTTNDTAIFGLNKDGSGYAVLHIFNSSLTDSDSYSGLVQGSDGRLYGTTFDEGALTNGSVFSLNKDGTDFQTLHSFEDTLADGGFPYGTVHEGSDGALYGTTSEGGPDDFGTLYKVNRDGTGYRVLRYFSATNNEGYLPVAPPVEGPGGLLYGTTYYGGTADAGTIYRVAKDGSGFAFLYDFQDDGRDGWEPNGPMIRGSDGALYGTTFYGSGPVLGSVFRIKPPALQGEKNSGGFTVRLEGFTGCLYGLDVADSLPPAWTQVAVLTNLTGTVAWPEPAPLANQRFYRARALNP